MTVRGSNESNIEVEVRVEGEEVEKAKSNLYVFHQQNGNEPTK